MSKIAELCFDYVHFPHITKLSHGQIRFISFPARDHRFAQLGVSVAHPTELWWSADQRGHFLPQEKIV